MNIKGLAPHTSRIFEALSHLECIKPYVLFGGTALSLQIGTQESEDLDFMSWRSNKRQKCEVDWVGIKKELSQVGEIQGMDILDLNQVLFKLEGVKLSFYANDKFSPLESPIHLLNNIYLADIESIGAMKMEVLMRRRKFRDYYDIYSILQQSIDIDSMITKALNYSQHRLKSKNLLSMLNSGAQFIKESDFAQLNPIYDVTPKDIELFIGEKLKTSKYLTK
ncbi:MAG: nucleotidyl transferase AbiEii/AbiGii toxin family protein [Bacteroidales bacterium]|nr:nucleotidyl transferase AbiEii/AbiGii toxin family protein [Bacteroidales bacterium]